MARAKKYAMEQSIRLVLMKQTLAHQQQVRREQGTVTFLAYVDVKINVKITCSLSSVLLLVQAIKLSLSVVSLIPLVLLLHLFSVCLFPTH